MTNHPNLGRKHRAREHMEAAGKMYPAAFAFIDSCRADKGKTLPDWPDWCFAPLAASYAAVCQDSGLSDLSGRLELVGDVARIAAIAAWRPSQGIYRFDPDLYQSITDTPINGDLPVAVLHYLPEWCQYIETPGMNYGNNAVAGFFVHLEWDANTSRHELRLLLDMLEPNGKLVPYVIHLTNGSLSSCIESVVAEATRQAVMHSKSAMITDIRQPTGTIEQIGKFISLALYLCSDGADYDRASRPAVKRTKSGWRMFPADKPTTWDVGVRIGAAIRKGREQSGHTEGDGNGSSVRPHVRRAHWHLFWTGPRDSERKPVVKWIAMTGVNMDLGDDTPSVIKGVRK